jgi:hypothetical protein
MIKNEILNRIEEEQIKPKSRWSFLLRKWVIWKLAILSFVFGSFSISILLFALVNHVQIPAGFWAALPWMWLLLLLVFLFVIYFNIKNSDRGYRHRFWVIALVATLATVLGGLVLYTVNAGSAVDHVLDQEFESYTSVEERLEHFWQNPEGGYLSGLITKVDFEKEVLEIIDLENKRWKVDYSTVSEGEKELIRNVDHIRVIGELNSSRNIEACSILPWFVKGAAEDRRGFSVLLRESGIDGVGQDSINQQVSNERIQEIIRSNKCK